MSTLVADPPATAQSRAPAQPQPQPEPPRDTAPAPQAPAVQRGCARCGSPLAAAQDWCLQCGAGAPGSIGGEARGLRAGAAALGAIALLAAGAAVAAYAAWGKSSGTSRPAGNVLARNFTAAGAATPVNPALPGAAGAPGGTASPRAGAAVAPNPAVGLFGGLKIKPPKIPFAQVTPKPAVVTPTTGGTTNTTNTTKTTTGGSNASALPAAILLDPNAASTYNPYAYALSGFGDPSLAIDGDNTTGWTAQVDPAVAPKMAVGLSIDLRSALRVGTVKIYTTTPGLAVQVYGTTSRPLPGSITDEAWTALSHRVVAKKKSTTIKLRDSNQKFGSLVLWISAAPASSVGTPESPGRVSVQEWELFPPAK